MNLFERILLTLTGRGWEYGRLFSGGTGMWRVARRHRLFGWLQVSISGGRWTSILPKQHRWNFIPDCEVEVED